MLCLPPEAGGGGRTAFSDMRKVKQRTIFAVLREENKKHHFTSL